LIGKRVYNIKEGDVVNLVIEVQEEIQELSDVAIETTTEWTPWQVLWIEETFKYSEVTSAYEKLMDECSFEDVRQLRELVLAMSVAYSYIRACFTDENQTLEDAIVMTEAEKSGFYQIHYKMANKSLKGEGVVTEKLIITLRRMNSKSLVATEIKAFLPQLTYEHLIISIYHPNLIAELKYFFGQQFEKIALSDGHWFNLFTAHLDALFTRALKEKEISRDIFHFGKWMNDFVVRLHEFPKYATNLKQPLLENRTFKTLIFSQLIKNWKYVMRKHGIRMIIFN